MSGIPIPLVLLVAALAVVGLVVLWKLLATAGLIGLTQWLVVTQTDSPTAALIAVGIPSLALAVLLRRATHDRSHRPHTRVPLRLRRQEVSS